MNDKPMNKEIEKNEVKYQLLRHCLFRRGPLARKKYALEP